MAWNIFTKAKVDTSGSVTQAYTKPKGDDIFKAYIPGVLYRPPFGMPRTDNTPMLKKLSNNPYVFSVIKTLADEASSIKWSVNVKEEFSDVNSKEEEEVDYTDKIKEITKFFRNPNGNEESFNHIIRQLITDICEVDAGVLVKVFDVSGDFKQMFARSGDLFLKNPDIYGYMGNRADFVTPLPDGFTGVGMDLAGNQTNSQQQLMKQYSLLYKEQAAYFQYGWTAGSMPVPFGKREVVYMMQNPRSDSIYGTSPVSVLMKTILNLVYGIDYNLDIYINNNMPDGVIELLGATAGQMAQYRENMEKETRKEDEFGFMRKIWNKIPIVSSPAKFVPFQLSSKEMEIIAQQEWFTKVLWMNFGVTADELGFSQDSNKATGDAQIKNAKRKALGPLLKVIQYHLNTQIVPEFFTEGSEMADFADVPLQFEFDVSDIDDDIKELTRLKMEKDLGIKTEMMIAKERGINLEELKEGLDERREQEMELMEKTANLNNPAEKEGDKPKEKPKEVIQKKPEVKAKKTPLSELNSYIDGVEKDIVKTLEELPNESLDL
ncbi:MAG: phage portal protein [Candidatus Heimdallarchaeaceae archaeon]